MMPRYLEIIGVGYAQALIAWSASYVLHGTLLCALVAFYCWRFRPSLPAEELAWRVALFGAPVTATVRVFSTMLSPREGQTGLASMLGTHSLTATIIACGWIAWVLSAFVLVTIAAVRTRSRMGPRVTRELEWARNDLMQWLSVRSGSYVRLTTSSAFISPAALGFREICLPEHTMAALPPAGQRAVLAHEAAHIARRDPLWRFAADVVTLAFPFHVLARIARARLLDLGEFACDAEAVRMTGQRKPLLAALSTLGEMQLSEPFCAASFRPRPSRLMQRAHRIVSEPLATAQTIPLAAVCAAVLTLVLFCSLGPAVRLDPESAVNHIAWLAPSRTPTAAALEIQQQQRKVQRTIRDGRRRR